MTPEVDEDTKKRPRVDGSQSPGRDDAAAARSPSPAGRRESIAEDDQSNRKPPVSKEEEKRRGKRLFGGLLSTLSQKTSSTQQRKRREIEQRQQEKAQKQKVEDDRRLAERVARINKARRHEQVDFDEKVVRQEVHLAWRSRGCLADNDGPDESTARQPDCASAFALHESRAAHRTWNHRCLLLFGATTDRHTQYYKPWKLTAAQEDMLDEQVADAKATAARETAQFARQGDDHGRHHGRHRASSPRGERPPRWTEADRSGPPRRGPMPPRERASPPRERMSPRRDPMPPRDPTPEPERPARSPPAEPEPEPAASAAAPVATTNGSPERDNNKTAPAADRDQHEEHGDVVVDNEEDMVMY